MEYFKRQSPTGFDVFEQTPTGERKIELPEFQSLGLNVDLLGEKPISLEQGRDVETRAFIASGGQLGQPSAAQTAGFGFTPSPQGTEEGGTLTVPQGINIEGFTRGLTPEAKQLAQQGAVTTGALPQEQTNFYQNLEERLKKSDDFVSQLMSLYVPTPQETELQKQLDEITMAAKEGVIEAGQRPATMGFVTGTQRAIEQRANTKLEGIQRELQRLQGNREGQLKAVTAAYDIKRQSVQDALAFYKATAPDMIAEDGQGNVFFRNPITGQVTATKLPGFQAKPKGYESGIIGEYQYYADQETAAGKKPLSFSEYQDVDANRKAKASGAGGLTTAQYLTQIGRMADDVRSDPDVKDFVQIRDGYERVQTGATLNNAQGDLALLFGYMKILDPNSVVRETEFANAEAAMGYAQRILNIPAKFIKGARLTEEARGQFSTAAKALYKSKEQNYQKAVEFYTNQANTIGLDPNLVLRKFESGINDQQQAESDIQETIQANSGENREQLIERLVPAFPEFTIDDIARYVYTLIPDKK